MTVALMLRPGRVKQKGRAGIQKQSRRVKHNVSLGTGCPEYGQGFGQARVL